MYNVGPDTTTGEFQVQTCGHVLGRKSLCWDCSGLRCCRPAVWERGHPLRRQQTGCVWCEAAALSLLSACVRSGHSSRRRRTPGEGHGHSRSCGHSWGAVLWRWPCRRGLRMAGVSHRPHWRGCRCCGMEPGDRHSQQRRRQGCLRQGCRRQGRLRPPGFPMLRSILCLAVACGGLCSGSSCKVHRGPSDVCSAHIGSETSRRKGGRDNTVSLAENCNRDTQAPKRPREDADSLAARWWQTLELTLNPKT